MNKDVHQLFEAYKSKAIKEQSPAEEVGVNPEDAAVYDQARADISYEKFSAWDAYHAVKEGAWTEDDFLQWTRSVWADGADNTYPGA